MSAPLTPLSAADLNAKSPSKTIQKSDGSQSWTLDEPFASNPSIKVPSLQNSSSRGTGQPSNLELFNIGNVQAPTKAPSPSKGSPAKISSKSQETTPLRYNEGLTRVMQITKDTTPLRYNEGLTKVIQTMQEDVTLDYQDEGDSMTTVGAESVHGDIDDTAFSAFSAVPNADMTLFARFGQDHGDGSGSPVKQPENGEHQHGLVSDTIPHDILFCILIRFTTESLGWR